MSFVQTVSYSEADGELKALYDQMLQRRGRISNVMSVSSLRPQMMKTLIAHNSSVMRAEESGLTAAERQMIATVVSALNRCQY